MGSVTAQGRHWRNHMGLVTMPSV